MAIAAVTGIVEQIPHIGPESLSSATKNIFSSAIDDAISRRQWVLGTENILRALLTTTPTPFIVQWMGERIQPYFNVGCRDGGDWCDQLLHRLHPVGDPYGDGPIDVASLPLSGSLVEVFGIVEQIISSNSDRNRTVTPEMLLASIVVHGVNNTASALAGASQASINSRSVLTVIGVPFSSVLVTRSATESISENILPADAHLPPPTSARLIVDSLPSLDDRFPTSPTPGSNWLIPGHLICGSHPSNAAARALQAAGVTTFVSLIGEYSTERYFSKYPQIATVGQSSRFIHFPINDFDVPDLTPLVSLVIDLRRRINEGEVVYVHCLGGHGRTGTVVIPLISRIYRCHISDAAQYVTKCTSTMRPEDRRWIIDMPETRDQRDIVHRAVVTIEKKARR